MALNKKHRKTLEQVFTDPVPATINWKDIERLVVALGGEIRRRRGSRVALLLEDRVSVFHEPHPHKETKKGAVVAVRKFLISAGVQP